jgi:hypothetical protein
MRVDGRLPIGQRKRDLVIHSLTADIGQFKHCNSLVNFFLWKGGGRTFSRWIVTNITSARGTVHCRKTRIPCGNKLVICGQHRKRAQTDLFEVPACVEGTREENLRIGVPNKLTALTRCSIHSFV